MSLFCVLNLGHCCIKYSVCEDEELAFSLDTVDEEAKTEADCTQDYLHIQRKYPIIQNIKIKDPNEQLFAF